ncbi:MAG: tRNA (adenosine(37)-N6)-threonylcarbamoyltransferase complex dimerization subunit type 1 TsaB [Rhodospirillaceae bacterium]|nr:tRNA (adenosine(37)-N6)-threonylcarbamoyltransferase complex dimerization subunit type 1 TsaB [Rhodospirillaceae bacterium]
MSTTPIHVGAPRTRVLLPAAIVCATAFGLAVSFTQAHRPLSVASGPTIASGLTPQLVSTSGSSPSLNESDTDWRDMPLVETPPTESAVPPIDKESDRILWVSSTGDLVDMFETLGYDFDRVRDDGGVVPRLFLAELPADFTTRADAAQRIDIFFRTLLPLTLRVNERIALERARLVELHDQLAAGATLTDEDRQWLTDLAEAYNVAPADGLGSDTLQVLLRRVDIVPPSMALAQAAVESGWGTSSLARNGNALFGQVGLSGMRANTGHVYATFDQLIDAVDAYVYNLNTNPAYWSFRAMREAQRQAGQQPDGLTLIGGLTAYSELGQGYIGYIRGFIRTHDLESLDTQVAVTGRRPLEPAWPSDICRRIGGPAGRMLILAVDTAGDACSVALCDGDGWIAGATRPMRHGHAEALMPMVVDALATDSGIRRRSLRRHHGPGAFTGLRIGIAAVAGMALAGDRPIVGMTALLPPPPACRPPRRGHDLLVALDSRRSDPYLQSSTRIWHPSARLVRPAGRSGPAPADRPILLGRQCRRRVPAGSGDRRHPGRGPGHRLRSSPRLPATGRTGPARTHRCPSTCRPPDARVPPGRGIARDRGALRHHRAPVGATAAGAVGCMALLSAGWSGGHGSAAVPPARSP